MVTTKIDHDSKKKKTNIFEYYLGKLYKNIISGIINFGITFRGTMYHSKAVMIFNISIIGTYVNIFNE